MSGWDYEVAVSESLIRTASRLDTLAQPRAYALMILTNKWRDHLRGIKHHREVPVGVGTAAEDDYLEQVVNGAPAARNLDYLSFSDTTKAVLRMLSERDREVLVLQAYDFSTAEIGERINLSPESTRAVRKRAFQAFRKKYAQLFTDRPSPVFPADPAEVL
ncbi:RNA polymerase sigma factor [Streptomyces mirabilis]|uniref:RNA polymerase sigma factor n=1 Tax=Streptomyces mirabilis TaxID=68239 RepID=UPI0036C9E9BE